MGGKQAKWHVVRDKDRRAAAIVAARDEEAAAAISVRAMGLSYQHCRDLDDVHHLLKLIDDVKGEEAHKGVLRNKWVKVRTWLTERPGAILIDSFATSLAATRRMLEYAIRCGEELKPLPSNPNWKPHRLHRRPRPVLASFLCGTPPPVPKRPPPRPQE